MANNIEQAADLLFPNEGRRTLNIKFLDACEHHVTADELAAQIVFAETTIRDGGAELVADID